MKSLDTLSPQTQQRIEEYRADRIIQMTFGELHALFWLHHGLRARAIDDAERFAEIQRVMAALDRELTYREMDVARG